MKLIDRKQIKALIDSMANNTYRAYLEKVVREIDGES
jgi:hypothetical protein